MEKLKQKITNLKHGDLVIINNRKGHVGTVGGYAVQYNENPIEAIEREKDKIKNIRYYNGTLHWINQEASCICADKGYYEEQKAIWSKAIELIDGQLIWLDGELLTVHYKGNYSDMADFRKL